MTSVFPYALSCLFFCKTFFQLLVYIFLFSVYLAFGAMLLFREKGAGTKNFTPNRCNAIQLTVVKNTFKRTLD